MRRIEQLVSRPLQESKEATRFTLGADGIGVREVFDECSSKYPIALCSWRALRFIDETLNQGISLRETQRLSLLQTTRSTLVRPARFNDTTVACGSAQHIRSTDSQTEDLCDIKPHPSPTTRRGSLQRICCWNETDRATDNVGLGWGT